MREEAPVFPIESETLGLRELEGDDWPVVEAILLDGETTRHMHFASWTDKQRRAWFEWALANRVERVDGNYTWAIVSKDTGALVGWIMIGDSDPARGYGEGARGMGYILSRECWGRGYMTEAVRAVIAHEFSALGARRVLANCETTNVASAQVMEKAGMRFVRTATEPDFEGNVAERHYYAIRSSDWMRFAR